MTMPREVDLLVPQSKEGERRAIARLLAWAPARFVALPAHTTLEVIEHPEPVDVPCAPGYVLGLLAWQQQWLPMIDLRAFLEGALPVRKRPRYALIVAWQSAPGARIEHGALGLESLPETVSVDDGAACLLPLDDGIAWAGIALACFSHGGQPVPILDTARLLKAPQ
jgi:chemotaxis signal transduction protein